MPGQVAKGETLTTGIVRHIDELGRIVIPIEIRKRLGIAERDPVEIAVKGETIMLAKAHNVCLFCGRDEDLTEHRGRPVCRSCIGEMSDSGA